MRTAIGTQENVPSGLAGRFPGSNTGVNLLWSSVNAYRPLMPNEIDVWRVDLDISDARRERLLSILSPDEAARAALYRFPELGRRYIAGRGALRCILGRCLGIDPKRVRFDYEANGKPILASPPAPSGALSFNITHSHELALCVVTRERRIGVDVEHMLRTVDMESIAQRYFSPHEYAALQSAPLVQRRALFFRYWTCKEACIKATGKGLSQLEDVEVVLSGARPGRWKSSGRWRLYELSPKMDFAAAVAAEGCDHVLRGWHYAHVPE